MQKTSDFFRHTDKFTSEPIEGVVTGTVPKWLEGIMLRNGPGIQQIGPDHYEHFFDGQAVLHRFEIKDGKVKYMNRALMSDSYKRNLAVQRIIVNEFGTVGVTDPCKSLFDRFKATFIPSVFSSEDITDNCNVNLGFYGDQLYAMTETEMLRRVDPDSLETLGPKYRLTDYAAINQATAHPHILEDGTVVNLGSNHRNKKGPHYCIFQIPPAYDSEETNLKEAKIVAEIPMRWKMHPGYYHSFGLTENYFIFIEQPYCMSIPKLMTANLMSRTFRDCLSWHPNQTTRFHIVDRKTGAIEPGIMETKNLFTFHHVNAYEENGNIILDLCGYDNAHFVDDITTEMKQTGSMAGASCRRYVLPVRRANSDDTEFDQDILHLKDCNAKAMYKPRSRGSVPVIEVTPHKFTDWFEFPRINYKYNGKKYNFFYGCEASPEAREASSLPEQDILSKFDIEQGKTSRWIGKSVLPSEPIFVVDPTVENPKEDDGVVLSAILHKGDPNLVSLLILDAKDMSEIASVKFKAAGPVAATFHGIWAHSADKVHLY